MKNWFSLEFIVPIVNVLMGLGGLNGTIAIVLYSFHCLIMDVVNVQVKSKADKRIYDMIDVLREGSMR